MIELNKNIYTHKYIMLSKEEFDALSTSDGVILSSGVYLRDEPGNIYIVDGKLYMHIESGYLNLGSIESNIHMVDYLDYDDDEEALIE